MDNNASSKFIYEIWENKERRSSSSFYIKYRHKSPITHFCNIFQWFTIELCSTTRYYDDIEDALKEIKYQIAKDDYVSPEHVRRWPL